MSQTEHVRHSPTEPPYREVVNDALRKASSYRQLLAQIEKIIEEDISQIQPFYMEGMDETGPISITVNRENYQGTKFSSRTSPPESYSGTLIQGVDFGYKKKGGDIDRIGTIPWIIIGEDGKVTHIGANGLLRKHFEEHLFGWSQSHESQEITSHILSTLIRELRSPFSKHGCRKLLEQFLQKRGHDPKWGKKGGFALYDPTRFDIRGFARRNKFSNDAMYRAGLYDISISKRGEVFYNPNLDKCVLIPFFPSRTGNLLQDLLSQFKKNTCSFRMRMIEGKPKSPKYKSFPFIRSIATRPLVDSQMYNNHLLTESQGKDVFLTEGEFKCHVATQKTGFITLGILGITMVSDEMLDRILTCGAKSLTIVLDADIGAKAVKRADGITDSERAAYEIAFRLERRVKELGLDNIPVIRIGKLQKTAEGDKQGLDDYLLPMSRTDAVRAMERIRDEAKPLPEYASSIGKKALDGSFGLNEPLAQIKIIRSEVRNALFAVEQMLRRGTKDNGLEEMQNSLTEIQSSLEKAWRTGLWQLYGVNRLNLPMSNIKSLKAGPVPDARKKRIKEGAQDLTQSFTGDIACFEFYFSDMPTLERTPSTEAFELPYSMREVLQYFMGIRSSEQIYKDFVSGSRLVGFTDYQRTFTELQRNGDIKTFIQCILAGFAEHQYKYDEYNFHRDLRLIQIRDRSIETFGSINLAISSKKSGKVEGIVFCPHWRVRNLHENGPEKRPGYYHSFSQLSEEQRNWILTTLSSNPARASLKTGIEIARVRSFLRSPVFELQRIKFDRIVTILSQDEIGRARAKEFYRNLPLPEGYLDQLGAVILTPEDLKRLASQLDKKDLLNQALQAGLYRLDDSRGIVPAFLGAVEILPTVSRGVRSIRVGPLTLDDHTIHYDSRPKPFYPVHGARSVAASMDPNNQVFLGENLARAKGKTVIIAQNERDAMVLDALLPTKTYAVIGLNSELTPRSSIISLIKRSGCLDVVYVGGEQSHGRYDHLSEKSLILELLDLERRFQAIRKGEEQKILRWAPAPCSIATWVAQCPNDASKLLEEFISIDCQPLQNIPEKILGITKKEYRLVASLARALEAYEGYLEDPTSRSETNFPRTVRSLRHQKELYHSFLKSKYGIETTESLTDWLNELYNQPELSFPTTELQLQKFRKKHSAGVQLRKLRKDLNYDLDDSYIEQFHTLLGENEILKNPSRTEFIPLASDDWRKEVGRLALENLGKEAKRLNYLKRLEQIIGLAIKSGMITAPNGGRVFETKHISTRTASASSIKRIKEGAENSNEYIPQMAVATVAFNFKGEELKFVGHGRSVEAAKHLAAKNAFNFLKKKRLPSAEDKTLGTLWRLKYTQTRKVSP